MKTIAYVDLCAPSIINKYIPSGNTPRVARITEALNDLKHTGNIAIYLFKKNKKRLLTVRNRQN